MKEVLLMNSPKKLLPTVLLLAGAAFLAGHTFAAADDLYVTNIAQGNTGSISKVTRSGTQTTFSNQVGPSPVGLAFDRNGNLFVSLYTNGEIYKFAPNGTQTVFATNIVGPCSLAFDGAGNLFVAQAGSSGSADGSILKITPNGTKSTFIPNLNEPRELAFDKAGNLFVGDLNLKTITKYSPTGAGTLFGSLTGSPSGIAFDHSGNLFVTEFRENNSSTIQKFTPNGTKSTFASQLSFPRGIAFDGAGNLYVAEQFAKTILRFTPGGSKTIFASNLPAPYALAFEPPRGNSLNISTRLGVQTGDNALIAGFIITGPSSKSVLVRGMGPTLTTLGVPGALQDPTIAMHFPTGVVISNDNWKNGNAQPSIQGTAFAPSDDRESALAFNIPPGNYSVVERGVGDTTGVGLVEVYDFGTSENARLANISTRGFVGAGDNVMIGGFILGGNGARVIVRALGPSLADAGVSGALTDPELSLRDGNGNELFFNDDWPAEQSQEIQSTGIPPTKSLESAIVLTLPNGNYTAIVQGHGGVTGIGLVEVYNLQ